MLSVVEEKILRDRAANARAVVLDLTRGAPQSGAFDLVCTLMTMHHVPDPEGLLEAFRGVLAPGGILCVADLDVEDGSFHGPGFTGHRGFARGDLAARMRAAGFVAVRFSTPYEIRRDIGGVTKTYPLFLAVAVRPP
jgi:SAM-dependent methyltransferase